MIPADVLILFIAASAALAIAPGPDNLYVLAQSALHGHRTGLMITFGLCTGLMVHISAVALGIATLVTTSAVAFTMLKIFGAGYLLYLAWQAFKAGRSVLPETAGPPLGPLASYGRGVIMNISNPKVAVFFIAFLPQFADPARGPVALQVGMLGVVFLVTAIVIFSAICLAAGRVGPWLRKSPRAQVAINRVTGTIFVLLACRLVISR
ncbi:MAG: LysE family translocator [Chromatiales bacterium]|nr:LysE family translocator [Chromatiales bacterium]